MKKNKLEQAELLTVVLDVKALGYFSDYIEFYGAESSDLENIKQYIELKITEKEIEYGFNNELITKDEFYNFLFGHLYTRFVINQVTNELAVTEVQLEEMRKQLDKLFFVPL